MPRLIEREKEILVLLFCRNSPLSDILWRSIFIQELISSRVALFGPMFSSLGWFRTWSIWRWTWSSISTWISPPRQITDRNNDENTSVLDTERAFDISITFSSLSPVTMLDKNSVKHKCCALQRWVLTNYRLTHGFYRSHLAECQIFINNTTTATWIFEIPWNPEPFWIGI